MSVIYNLDDTIAAISTPLGTGGVGIVRISGKNAEKTVSKIFTTDLKSKKLPEFEANRIYYGWIYEDKNNELIPCDEVILLCFRAPKSFTGEDVFEIHCHGGINIVKKILKLCLTSGARLAEKGEFSKRAFVNGKIDLSKAEAIIDLIHSKTDRFSEASAVNLSGRLAQYINEIRDELLQLLSEVTAAIDFPEEVEEPEYNYIEEKISKLIKKIDNVLNGSVCSNLMRNGLKVAIAGRPNVGKSSLFNAILNTERAIVTDIPGTTRDIIQESIDIEGIPVTLIDTAGIRELQESKGSDYVESLGINLTKDYVEKSDIVLFLYDSSRGILKEDRAIYNEIKHKKILKIASKADLSKIPQGNDETLMVSSRDKTGLNQLRNEIKNFAMDEDSSSEFCTNTRQQECLKNAREFLQKSLCATINNEIQDLIYIDLKSALISLGKITGEVVSEEILDNIFSNFCIGK